MGRSTEDLPAPSSVLSETTELPPSVTEARKYEKQAIGDLKTVSGSGNSESARVAAAKAILEHARGKPGARVAEGGAGGGNTFNLTINKFSGSGAKVLSLETVEADFVDVGEAVAEANKILGKLGPDG